MNNVQLCKSNYEYKVQDGHVVGITYFIFRLTFAHAFALYLFESMKYKY